MIYGIGVDLVSIPRIRDGLERFGQRFAEKILSDSELTEFKQSNQQASFIAKRFAAKEAFAKALGLGFRDGLTLKQISIVHNTLGKPSLVCADHADKLLSELAISNIHLSLTDESHSALAYVIIETDS